MPAPAPVPQGPEPTIRIRAGANGALALFFPGPSYGANFNGRFGVQIKKLLGVYGDFGGGFGFGGSIVAGQGVAGVNINLVSYWRLGAMAEFDLGPFFIAAGPYLFNGTWAGVSQIVDTSGGASQAVYAASGYFPALLGRIGFSIGKRNRFTIALETMVVFGKMTSISQEASMNGAQQTVRIGNPAIGLAPALMLGWDMR